MAQSVALAEFESLFKEHHKSLCDLVFNLVKDKDIAKDIVQDVYFKFWKNRDKIEITAHLKSYLVRAATNTSLNHLRSIKRVIRLDDRPHLVASLQAEGGTEDVGFKYFEQCVQEAIERLPPRCKVIYQLSRQEDMSHQQIADSLNLSVKTIENQLSIALQKLRKELKPFLVLEFVLLLVALAYVARLLY
jgi:RNA polymerase sigma-70 factor, ECF subfamily